MQNGLILIWARAGAWGHLPGHGPAGPHLRVGGPSSLLHLCLYHSDLQQLHQPLGLLLSLDRPVLGLDVVAQVLAHVLA